MHALLHKYGELLSRIKAISNSSSSQHPADDERRRITMLQFYFQYFLENCTHPIPTANAHQTGQWSLAKINLVGRVKIGRRSRVAVSWHLLIFEESSSLFCD